MDISIKNKKLVCVYRKLEDSYFYYRECRVQDG